MIREQKRKNNRLVNAVAERREAFQKQIKLTDRIEAYEQRQTETALNLTMSIDGGISTFNPSISIAQHTEFSGKKSPTGMVTSSIEQTIESTQKTEQVHNLYAKLIQNDLQTSKIKTKVQLDLEKLNMEHAKVGIDELKEENKILIRNVKRTKQVLKDR